MLENIFFGNETDDFTVASNGIDIIFGLGGNDTILGGAGTDFLFGGLGNDRLEGGDDVDLLPDNFSTIGEVMEQLSYNSSTGALSLDGTHTSRP
ncbi:MAG: hypothetical protein AAFN08_01630 [Cyanobacteria bacterium J06559_3]